jgi:hypothetical protein
MHTSANLRLLVGLVFILAICGVVPAPAAAAGVWDWSDTKVFDDASLQTCNDFSLIASYVMTREHHVVVDDSGQQILERRRVRFSGTIARTSTIQALPYDGEFTRTLDYDKNEVEISNFVLRLESLTAGEITVAIPRPDPETKDNPLSILLEFAPNSLGDGLCGLFGGSVDINHAIAPGPEIPLSPPPTLPTPCDPQPQDPARPQSPSTCESESSTL